MLLQTAPRDWSNIQGSSFLGYTSEICIPVSHQKPKALMV